MTKPTSIITIRLSQEQIAALKQLPEEVSISALARALFAAYLEGSLDFLQEEIYDEIASANVAVKSGQQHLIALKRGKGKKHESRIRPRGEASLRERLLLRFAESRSEAGTGN